MPSHITQFAITVLDYDAAIDFYLNALGFDLLEDTDLGGGKRWVRVAPPRSDEPSSPAPPAPSSLRADHRCAILLARAVTPEQIASVGNQTGGRVFVFIHTDDLARDHRRMTERGVRFIRQPTKEPFGTVAVFLDLYGNKFDLIQPRG